MMFIIIVCYTLRAMTHCDSNAQACKVKRTCKLVIQKLNSTVCRTIQILRNYLLNLLFFTP